MRVYWPISLTDLKSLESGASLDIAGRTGVAATEGFAATLETADQDELDLMAALAASDIADGLHPVAVTESTASVVDDELGEVQLSGTVALADIECLMIADVDSQELSWFGIQEIAELEAAQSAKGK
jgi:hypothetical protein